MDGLEEIVRQIVREEVRSALRDWQEGGVEALAAERLSDSAALGLGDAAKYLGLRDEGAVRGLVRRREIDHLKVGQKTVIPRAALDQYIAVHTVPTDERSWGLTEGALRNLRDGRRQVVTRDVALPTQQACGI